MTDSDLSGLGISCNGVKRVSDVVDYARDIEPYNLIYLWAGVGAGKNYFVENFFTGRGDFPKLTVLLISSRKSKVVETLHRFDDTTSAKMTNGGNASELNKKYGLVPSEFRKTILTDNDEICEVIQQSVICTNAYIQSYHRYIYDPIKPETHLWNRFDLIVWDEAHALLTDSTYQPSPFYVAKLIEETMLRIGAHKSDEADAYIAECCSPRCKKVMIMTGTPGGLESVLSLPTPHVMDLRDSCTNVMPRNIHFLDSIQAEVQIREQLASGERVIYFSNHVVFPDEASKKYAIPNDQLAVSFSDDERRTKLKEYNKNKQKGVNDYERMEMTEDYLATNECLPPDVQLFITTSRNKEGININDTDISHVYIESHNVTDIIQMAGRVRYGAENLYIILDAPGFNNDEHSLESFMSKQLTREGTNSFSQSNENLAEFCHRYSIDNLIGNRDASFRAEISANKKIIDYIELFESKYKYLQYDFIQNKFCYNLYREIGRKSASRERAEFDELAQNLEYLVDMFQQLFPDSNVHMPVSREDEAMAYALDLQERFNSGKLTNEEFLFEIDHLDMMTSGRKNAKRRKAEHAQPNRVLKRFNLSITRPNHRKSPNDFTGKSIIQHSS